MKLASVGDKNVKSDNKPLELPVCGKNQSPNTHAIVTYWCLNVAVNVAVVHYEVVDELEEEGTAVLAWHNYKDKVAAEMWGVDASATRYGEDVSETSVIDEVVRGVEQPPGCTPQWIQCTDFLGCDVYREEQVV